MYLFGTVLSVAASGCGTLQTNADSMENRPRLANIIAQSMGGEMGRPSADGKSIINCKSGPKVSGLRKDLDGRNKRVLPGSKKIALKYKPVEWDENGKPKKYTVCLKSEIPAPDTAQQPDESAIIPPPHTEPAAEPKKPDSDTKLRVNTDAVHYKISKSREDGEKDLIELSETADKEEAWVFIKDSNGDSVWHEVGYNEKTDSATTDLNMIKSLPADTAEISVYHHHPVEKIAFQDTSQTPSGKDAMGFLQGMQAVMVYNPELLNKIDFRVVTSSGVYVFKFKPGILTDQKLLDKVNRKINELDIERLLFPHFDYRHRNRANFQKENAGFARRFSNGLMQITFIPNNNPRVNPSKKIKVIDLGGIVRDKEGIAYEINYLPELKRIYLKSYGNPVLYDENGDRIGFETIDNGLSFREPSNGWPTDSKGKIELDGSGREMLAKKKAKLIR